MSEYGKMPEQLDVYIGHRNDPHHVIPGMMSLDELAEHGFYIGCWSYTLLWGVRNRAGSSVSGQFDTALEAQWAATCLARKNVDHAETNE